jgi:Zn-finger nucleic acid-binding protein
MAEIAPIHHGVDRSEHVLCTGCNTSVYPTGRQRVPISQLCPACVGMTLTRFAVHKILSNLWKGKGVSDYSDGENITC